jgi:hypothetical protein
MKPYDIREIIKTDDGMITIVHTEGSCYYNEQDVLLIEWKNDFFSRLILNKQTLIEAGMIRTEDF